MNELFERLSNLPQKRLALLAMELQERLDAAERARTEPIAVVGMACRFPGAPDLDAYWDLLVGGVDAVREVPATRWDVDELYDADPDAPGRIATRWAGLLEEIDRFEPQLFGIAPREAQSMDPQQRLLLEVAWEALEHAAIAPDSLVGSATGVYVGACNADYAQLLMEGDPADFDMYLSTGNASSVASGRLSYVFGLHGPAITVDTACSSSLVAVDLAVRGLRSGSCRLALAGGVNVLLSAKTTMTLSRAKMMAADGRCKTFDASADGFVRGEGCGLVVLKRLSDAVADGDRVMAVIRGSATNQDGRSNGLTAPNGPSQVAVIRAALADAGVAPSDVGYVETHGTGTALGDPIETQALGAALGDGRSAADPVLVGSVKTNIGHLESAAGIAGLIKAVLCLHHGRIPPSLHLRNPSPLIPWDRLPITVPTTVQDWPRRGQARLAGVSSFGFSGTNVHLIVGEPEAPGPVSPTDASEAELILLSARTDRSLRDTAERWAASLRRGRATSIRSVARAAGQGRADLTRRVAIVAADEAGLAAALDAWADSAPDESVVADDTAPGRPPEVAWLFTGHGSQYAGMGRDLYRSEPVYRDAIDRCAALLAVEGDSVPLDAALDGPRSAQLLSEMATAQPAVFAVEYALAELWRSWGVEPAVVAGHSVGEYVAAVVAGVMRLEDGLRLVAARGRLMASLPPDGEMATVLAPVAEVEAVVEGHGGRVSIAAINGPASVALSGPSGAMTDVLDAFRAAGVEVRRLAIPVAAHSPQVDPILDEFERVADTIAFSSPVVDVVSGMTGRSATGDDLVTAAYWRQHLRRPVRFADAVVAIHDRGVRTWLELGPHPTLLNMARHTVPERDSLWLPSLRSGHGDRRQVLTSLGRLWAAGVPIDRRGIGAGAVPADLPTYPFDRARYWALAPQRHGPRSHRHALVGTPLQSPALTDTVVETEVGATWPPFLDDHRVFGTAILPSPAFLELALSIGDDVPCGIEGFEIREALVLPEDDTQVVQVVVDDERDRAGRHFEIVSRDRRGDGWTVHAAGRLVEPPALEPATRVDVDPIRQRCTDSLAGDELYERLAALGLEFGPSFRGVRELWRRDGEVLGRVELPDAIAGEAPHYRFHPALLDACFHLLGAALPSSGEDEAALLVGIDEYVVRRAPGRAVWSHVTVRDAQAGDGVITGDISVIDDEGNEVATVGGVHLRRMGCDGLMRSAQAAAHLVHEVRWHAVTPSPHEVTPDHRFVVVGDAGTLAASLARALAVSGTVTVADDLAQLREALGDGVECRVVLAADPASDVGDAVTRAVEVTQVVIAGGGELWLVTSGAQPVDGSVPVPAQAALWGLGRVVAIEHPDRWGGVVDLPNADGGAPGRDDIDALVAAVGSSGDEDQFAIRSGRTYVPRLVPRSAPRAHTPPVRHDRSYLVTGGLGGLGLQTARWLAASGAGTIVLVGRNPLPDRAAWDADHDDRTSVQIATVRQLEAAGTRVVTVAADVADRAAMAQLVERFGVDLPPLGGVLHLAASLGNVTVAEMTADDVHAMLRPKAAGADVLDELTAPQPLDFFVLFSSTTALWGSRLLGHYAAANQYLDAVAHRRRAAGRPALSVNWGTWDEMRVATEVGRAEVVSAGLRSLPTNVATGVLGALLADGEAVQVTVADVDWPTLIAAYESRRPRPLLTEVGRLARRRRTTRSARADQPPALFAALGDVTADRRLDVVVEHLRREVARVLGADDPGLVDIDQGLFEMGMDSLMSVELKSQIEAAVGVDLPSTLTFNYPTVTALAGFLLDEVLSSGSEPAPASVGHGDGGSSANEALLRQAATDDMSEDDLAAMLAQRLADLR